MLEPVTKRHNPATLYSSECSGPVIDGLCVGLGTASGLQKERVRRSWDVKDRLKLLDETPLLHGDVGAVELLEGVDTGTRDVRVQGVLVFELTTVHGLVASLDLDGHGGLTPLADLDGLVITLN